MSLFAAVPTGKTQHFDGNWGYTNVCVWDVASAHILLEDAIRKEATLEKHLPGIAKEKIGGTSFFVSGPGKPWKTQDFKHTLVVSQIILFPSLILTRNVSSNLSTS